MENELKPRELSKDLVHNMHKARDTATKHSGVLQVLGVNENGSFLTLSDGYSYVDVALFRSIRPKVENLNIKPKDIIYVTLLLHKESIDVLVNFEKLYSDVDKVIGEPLSYANYLERESLNPQGDCAIPRILWDPPKAKSSSAAVTTNTAVNTIPRPTIVGSDDEVQKISLLTSGTTEFLIKGKVVKKSTRKEFNQGKGKGSVFDIVIADDSDEIKGSFFNTSCDKFYDLIDVGKVYIISNGEVRKGGKFNNTTNLNEIYFNSKTEIAVCTGETIKTCVKYKFKRIGDIMKEANYQQVDIAGVISHIGEQKEITLKSGESKAKQTFKIRDDSNYEIELTLWGNVPNQADVKEGDTVIITSVTIGEFNRVKVLNSQKDATTITINPDNSLPRVAELNKWKEAGQDHIKTLSTDKKPKENVVISIAQLKKETEFLNHEVNPKQQYTISGYVANFGTNFTYPKCPRSECFKRASQDIDHNGNNMTMCDAHGQLEQPPVPKYIGSLRIVDHTEQIYVNYTTDAVGQIVFGCDASEMNERAQNKDELNEFLKTRSGLKFTFKLYLKFETYQGQRKLKYVVQQCYDQIGNRLKFENITLLNTINKLQENLI